MIERIADDDAHDERARIARDRWIEEACPADWNRFDEAVTNSPEATELVEVAAIRLNRTIEILFGSGARLRDLPQMMIERLPPSLR
jgi:hypothetical protein